MVRIIGPQVGTVAQLVRALTYGAVGSRIEICTEPKNIIIMLLLTGYVCCALGQGTFLSFAPLHPGELNGYQPRLGK